MSMSFHEACRIGTVSIVKASDGICENRYELNATTPEEARVLRYQRLGSYSERDQRDQAYLRGQMVALVQRQRGDKLAHRNWLKKDAEDKAIKANQDRHYYRREKIVAERYAAIRARVQAEKRIRPAGKSNQSIYRFNSQMSQALYDDPEHQALFQRDAMFRLRHGGTKSRRHRLELEADVRMGDDRKERHRKAAGLEQTS